VLDARVVDAVLLTARLGPQMLLVTRQRSKRIPPRAMRSIFGVSFSPRP